MQRTSKAADSDNNTLLSSQNSHRARLFGESLLRGVKGGIELGAIPLQAKNYAALSALLTLPAAVVIGAVGGSIHGVIRSTTRMPVAADYIVYIADRFTKLEGDEDAQARIITATLQKYQVSYSSSASSKLLLTRLNDYNLSIDHKWSAITNYLKLDQSSANKNNGKRLFLILRDTIMHEINQMMIRDNNEMFAAVKQDRQSQIPKTLRHSF
jgi:hypothetical protein